MSDAAFDQLDVVDDRIDELSAALAPLLEKSVAEHATTLPVADKARLYVLTTYAVESLLFCAFPLPSRSQTSTLMFATPAYLRLQALPTKDHPVMRELTRVRQYVAKIKGAEPAVPPAMSLDKAAANRFIAAALVGNDKFDEERAERAMRERTGAEMKLRALEEGTKSKKEEEVDGEAKKEKKKKVKRSKEEKEARREERKGMLSFLSFPFGFLFYFYFLFFFFPS
jgi:exosome complex protein LRP1